ncbi:hypothetical protein [Streptomyces hydrogenans]|uniref:hypothetical protein n=1 Tax=Streptomyces hydrogenans TaxID=1873719 RepID=UPI0037F29C67
MTTASSKPSITTYECPEPGCTFRMRSASPQLLDRLVSAHQQRRHGHTPNPAREGNTK